MVRYDAPRHPLAAAAAAAVAKDKGRGAAAVRKAPDRAARMGDVLWVTAQSAAARTLEALLALLAAALHERAHAGHMEARVFLRFAYVAVAATATAGSVVADTLTATATATVTVTAAATVTTANAGARAAGAVSPRFDTELDDPARLSGDGAVRRAATEHLRAEGVRCTWKRAYEAARYHVGYRAHCLWGAAHGRSRCVVL